MSDATVRLSRTFSGIGLGAQSEQWNIGIDGTVVGSIANTEIVEVSVEPGHQGFGWANWLWPLTLRTWARHWLAGLRSAGCERALPSFATVHSARNHTSGIEEALKETDRGGRL
jgi:hypothetical protein